jgi:hypothetical protein
MLTQPRERETRLWARIAGLVAREDRVMATERFLEGEIRATLQEGWIEAARIVSGFPGFEQCVLQLRRLVIASASRTTRFRSAC